MIPGVTNVLLNYKLVQSERCPMTEWEKSGNEKKRNDHKLKTAAAADGGALTAILEGADPTSGLRLTNF